MARFNLDEYEPVEDRIRAFYGDYPEGRILTELVQATERQFIVKALVFADREDEVPWATGHAEEVVGSSPVNKTSALENAETSAIGRALANAGYAAKGKRPSREEMRKVVARPTFTPELKARALAAIEEADLDRLDAIHKSLAGFEVSDVDMAIMDSALQARQNDLAAAR